MGKREKIGISVERSIYYLLCMRVLTWCFGRETRSGKDWEERRLMRSDGCSKGIFQGFSWEGGGVVSFYGVYDGVE